MGGPYEKIFMFVLILLVILTSVNQAFAASGFSLAQGEISGNYLDNALLKEFFKNIKIEANFSQQQKKYTLFGTVQVESPQYEYPDGSDLYVGSDKGNGTITGEYDPLTGGFYGQLHYEAKFSGAVGSSTLTATVSYVDCDFTGVANPGDTNLVLSFIGKDLNKNKDVTFTTTFILQGSLPFTQITTDPTEEPEETKEYVETPQATPIKLKDSGAAFSDLSGQVEVLIPKGYDKYGKPDYGVDPSNIGYEDADWTFAKLDMPLPVDTIIKTSERSSVILSFADMTTFTMKPETMIILSPPTAKDSQFKLLVGTLWVNIKKMLKDGSMDIEMSQAIAGARGTTFVLEDDGKTSTLKVIEGTVEYTSKTTGESVMVEGGETVSATADGLGEIEEFDVEAEAAEWAEYGAKMPSEGFPLWAILAIGGGVALIAVIVIIAALSSRKKRKTAAATHPAYAQGAYPPPEQSPNPAAQSGFCTQCGAPLSQGATFCTKCGKKLGI